jgi:signal transduction histidine kinase
MVLSKKKIIAIISVTGILFSVLLIIQFIWIKRSVEVSRKQFENKMDMVKFHVRQTLYANNNLNALIKPASFQQDLFKGSDKEREIDNALVSMLDSVFKSQGVYMPCKVAGVTGPTCYIHNFTAGTKHNYDLDSSLYKICLCRTSRFNLDLGISFPEMNKYLLKDNSWLIIPSFLLIALLIALFIFIINIINKQKSLAELKNDFINNLTHEFNTPLFSIGLTSKLLMSNEAIQNSKRLKKYTELINEEKNKLQMQVDKMLQLTAIESGDVLMEKNIVDIHKVIEKHISGFSTAIEEKGGTLQYHADAVHHLIAGDEVHLNNVISNLLDNAYKYSDKPPEISITTSNIFKDIVISISDKGIGISDAAMKMIFDKFYREKRGDVHDVKGFGLGLSYVKKIIEMHAGSITVKSRKNEGTVFIINLPYRSN